jgi:hypothetical protein
MDLIDNKGLPEPQEHGQPFSISNSHWIIQFLSNSLPVESNVLKGLP